LIVIPVCAMQESDSALEAAAVSFRALMPIPHRARPSSTRAMRKKPPTPELTSDETMKFVSEVVEKQKKKGGAAAKRVQPSKQQQPIKKRGSSAVKSASVVEDDHEPCAMCKVAYGDDSDPKKKDNWEKCTRCKRWWHETCAALSGMYNRRMFSCDECTSKKRKKR